MALSRTLLTRRKNIVASANKPKRPSSGDRRSFKDLTIHACVECPVDPKDLPPDAVRVEDELLTVLATPSVPLHNNALELQARVSASRRDVSG